MVVVGKIFNGIFNNIRSQYKIFKSILNDFYLMIDVFVNYIASVF